MADSSRSLVWGILKRFAKEKKFIKLPKLDYPMPILYKANLDALAEICCLRTYPYNEGVVNDTIKIIEAFVKDIGLSTEQRKTCIIPLRGDLMQSKCNPEHRLDFVEATAGLFHLQMSVLQMLFFNHLGEKEDEVSLARWIVDLGRDKRQLWEKGSLPKVKDFRGCLDLVDTVLDGYIIAFIAEYCHFRNVKELLDNLECIAPKTTAGALEELNAIIRDHTLVTRMRQKQPTERDMQYEDLLLFIQSGLILRSFGKAMRIGDSGMVIECLSYFTIWYQGSRQTRYAAETMHWMACIKKLWSPQMKQFWMENAMVNPSGKKEGWMSCDYLGEFIVGQVKKAMHQNSNAPNEKFVFDDVSPLTLHFLNLRRQMMQECDVPYSSSHSTKVETHFDVEQIASYVLKEGFTKFVPGRMVGLKHRMTSTPRAWSNSGPMRQSESIFKRP